MAKERCVKKSFQDSLEDIKERMKEKRTKKLSKVATVNKPLSAKVQIISNTSVTVKSFQANNKALALALEAEKCKTRQAQDLILHLKREHQRLMFEIFMLRRKLNMQQGNNSSEAKLESLKEIIAKVTHNLLETANLLGPAHALCSSSGSQASTPASVEVKRSTPSPIVAPEPLAEMCKPAPDAQRNFRRVLEGAIPGKRRRQEETSEKGTSGNRISKGRTFSSSQRKSEHEKPEEEAEYDNSFLKNVSLRRRASSLNVCIEESSIVKSLEEEQNLDSRCGVFDKEIILPAEEGLNNDDVMDMYSNESPSKEEFIPFTDNCQISSSTPEPKAKQTQSVKAKMESRPGREKVRRGKADGQPPVPLKKPWEKSKPRARSKSRERGASRPVASKDKVNTSINSGDAYDFAFEESIHVTPFRQTKPSSNPEENEEPVQEQSIKSSSSSDEELNDSLYVPAKAKAKNGNGEKNPAALPLRPRSKRNKELQQQCVEQTENKSSEQTKQGESEGNSAALRVSLMDVTNLSSGSGSTESKKHSFPFADDNRKVSGSFMRKRRCTVTINYAEPNLSKKLRRGDPFTDTEFLLSPIFKNGDPKRKSINRKSLAKYNEAFVGCR
ncbi:shugoshin 1 isoform X2 [Hyla sarda]|uniref:shugoshin 1 isoform X2 n=1 Tax=Hyla sarda TaxID=327740 RepID=UPI0024C33CEA|nr:shugoshin 1 isoform X2 [Hyla sarda]